MNQSYLPDSNKKIASLESYPKAVDNMAEEAIAQSKVLLIKHKKIYNTKNTTRNIQHKNVTQKYIRQKKTQKNTAQKNTTRKIQPKNYNKKNTTQKIQHDFFPLYLL